MRDKRSTCRRIGSGAKVLGVREFALDHVIFMLR